MSNNNQTVASIGIKPWGTTTQKRNNYDNDDTKRLSFLKLNPGLNEMRIVTNPGQYYQARYKSPTSKKPYGDRVRTSYPTYDDCPVKNDLGIKPQPRFMVVVIDRADNSLKLFDMASSVAEGVENSLEAKNASLVKKGKPPIQPNGFDISVKFNPKSDKPAGFYSVVAGDTEPLSAEDLALIADCGGDEGLEKIVQRQIICPKRETVVKRLMDLGWDGKPVDKNAEESAKGEGSLAAPEEDDYAFPAQAGAENDTVPEETPAA
jgi:hypothetical protein